MKWVDFWNYISLQTWGIYGLKDDYDLAQTYYGLTESGKQIIEQYGGGSLTEWKAPYGGMVKKTNIVETFTQAETMKPKQTNIPKDTRIYYPTTRRPSQFLVTAANFNKCWGKMIGGRFQNKLSNFYDAKFASATSMQPPLLAHPSDMVHWEAGYYLIRTTGIDETIKNEIQGMKHFAQAATRLWEEIKNDPNNQSPTYMALGGFDSTMPAFTLDTEGYNTHINLLMSYRMYLDNRTQLVNRNGQMGMVFNNQYGLLGGHFTNAPFNYDFGYEWKDPNQLRETAGLPTSNHALVDLEPLMQKILTLNPDDYEQEKTMWHWIHIDKDRKNNLRDIHIITTTPQQSPISSNILNNVVVRPEGTKYPRWVGKTTSDERKIQIKAVTQLLIDGIGHTWWENDSAGLREELDEDDLYGRIDEIVTELSDAAAEDTEMNLTWEDFFNADTPLYNDAADMVTFSQKDSVWTHSYNNPWSGGHNASVTGFPYLYNPVTNERVYWCGWSNLENAMANIRDEIPNGQDVETALWFGKDQSFAPNRWREWDGGTGDADDNKYAYIKFTINPEFGEIGEPEAYSHHHQQHEKMKCHPRYFSTEGKSDLDLHMFQSWFAPRGQGLANINNTGIPHQMQHFRNYDTNNHNWNWKPDVLDDPTNLAKAEYAFAQETMPDGLTTLPAMTWQDTVDSANLVQNYQMHGWLTEDGVFKSTIAPNRVGTGARLISAVKNEPEFIESDKYFTLEHEICYWPNGFNLDTLADSGFTSFINWNAGFTRILWEFLSGE